MHAYYHSLNTKFNDAVTASSISAGVNHFIIIIIITTPVGQQITTT